MAHMSNFLVDANNGRSISSPTIIESVLLLHHYSHWCDDFDADDTVLSTYHSDKEREHH